MSSNVHSVTEQRVTSLFGVFKCFIKSALTVGLFHPGMRMPRARVLATPVPVAPRVPLLKAKRILVGC